MIPILLGELDRDDVHRHRARCQVCRRRCYLGPRQRAF